MQVEKRVTSELNAVSIAAEDEIIVQGSIQCLDHFGEDGHIDGGVRLAKVNLPPRRILLVECIEVVRQGYVRVKCRVDWRCQSERGSACGILDYRQIDDENGNLVWDSQ